ncbi:cell division protein FtsL [Candidatus Saccharibacteria bacterium]|nr:cell division protein FtsL [Candidatus Saccharibacteria bacterium]
MLQRVKNLWNHRRVKQLTDPRNIGLYIFLIVVLAISWSAVKTVQTNYELQKQISTLKQQNEVLKLQNQNTDLQNKYLQTDQYLELAARQDLGLAAPGEQVMLISKDAALKYVDQSLVPKTEFASQEDKRSGYAKNFEAWRNFLLGRQLRQD